MLKLFTGIARAAPDVNVFTLIMRTALGRIFVPT
jgi:hypothetical protein